MGDAVRICCNQRDLVGTSRGMAVIGIVQNIHELTKSVNVVTKHGLLCELNNSRGSSEQKLKPLNLPAVGTVM